MKGIILAGGAGTRLRPLTHITSKQLLPVYNKPLVAYPLDTLLRAGIRDILFITSAEHAGQFQKVFGSGKEYDAQFSYIIQDEPAGLAHGLSLAEHFVGNDRCAMILGDNVYLDDFSEDIKSFTSGAQIFVKQVDDARRFGVVELDDALTVLSIEEKPAQPKSNFAQTGLYLYDENVFEHIKTLQPSARGELEITDLNNIYLQRGELRAGMVQGEWLDAGTFDSLLRAANLMADLANR